LREGEKEKALKGGAVLALETFPPLYNATRTLLIGTKFSSSYFGISWKLRIAADLVEKKLEAYMHVLRLLQNAHSSCHSLEVK
jgi:hypothetical protein